MFGTVARMQLKPGADALLEAWLRPLLVPIPGVVPTTFYRSREDPRVVWASSVFESEEAYRKNAESPEQHRRWQQLRSILEGDIEWHDGDVMLHGTPERPATGPSMTGPSTRG